MGAASKCSSQSAPSRPRPSSSIPTEGAKTFSDPAATSYGTEGHDGTVMVDPGVLIAEFGDAATRVGLEGWPCQLRSEALPAPHQKPVLPHGEGAVYVFAISAAYGRSAPCGPGTVLKVGRVGPNNKRRFRHSHYLPTARTISTLAQSLLAHPILWPWLGIQHLDAAIVESWMLTNLDRFHFFMPGDCAGVRAAMEVYVRARVGSVFEGASAGSADVVQQSYPATP